ncbi:mechanosensitive ion channel [Algibacter miyuki]|uniref:Mechanosensitive ion channel n=1 Tax=Algibacter miyuki TaxID=1306933 RepID=A0ABV5H1A7_9FLAO|nr:mechanosensitive ion channel [Algibacter miyuki]MDN3664129.1 mechanosensitive ion channel [Algibacter miyuki]
MDYLSNVLDTLTKSIGGNLSNALSALIIIIIGWFIAGLLKRIILKIFKKTGVDDKLKNSKISLSKFISKLVYFLVMIFVFTLALEKLGMTNVLDPLKNMLNDFAGFVPNIIGAGLVCYIGYMLATIVSELVEVSGGSIQKFVPKLKLPENIDIVNVIKKIVFIFIFIPLLISAFNILNMDAISQPATAMLNDFFNAIPKVISASLILILFVVGGRFLSELIKDLLNSMNLNNFFNKAGLGSITGNTNLVKIIGNLVYYFIILFGLTTAVDKLEFHYLSDVLSTITTYSGKIIFGLIILAIGNWIANIAANNFAKNDDNAFVASIIRIAIIAIFLAIGLRTMGLADEIINLAFGISLGTVALTIILSFGLGGREAAGKQMDKILTKFNKK